MNKSKKATDVKKTKKINENSNKNIDNELDLLEEYHIETYETDICLEDGSFIEIDIDKIENEI